MALLYSVVAILWVSCVCIVKMVTEGAVDDREITVPEDTTETQDEFGFEQVSLE